MSPRLPAIRTARTEGNPLRRAALGVALTLALAATACGSSTTVGAPQSTSNTAADTVTATVAPTAAASDAGLEPAPTETPAAAAETAPDPSLPTELTVSLPGPDAPIADGFTAHVPATCAEDARRQQLLDFAVPAGWSTDIGNTAGTEFGTGYRVSLNAEAAPDVAIRNQDFLLIDIQSYVVHGGSAFGLPADDFVDNTPWFREGALNPLTVVADATIGDTTVPVYHSQTQGVEDRNGQVGGDIAVWQATGIGATWPVPEATRPGRLIYRIMVATDYERTDLPAEFRIDEAQAISIIESIRESACLRSILRESAANHFDPYVIE